MTPRTRSVALHCGIAAAAAVAALLDRRVSASSPGVSLVGQSALIAGGFAVFEGMERRRPHHRSWRPDRQELPTDLAFLVGGAVIGLAGEAFGHARSGEAALNGLPPAPRQPVRGSVRSIMRVAGAVLTFDLLHSRLHQILHTTSPGWRLHAVHHAPPKLWWGNAVRFHVIESLLDAALEITTLRVVRLSSPQVAAYRMVRAMYGQLQHCDIEVDSGPLDFVFSTPDLHRVHHANNNTEGNSNYGAVVSVWDQLFGTFHRTPGREPAQLGLGHTPVFPTRWLAQQLAPVRWHTVRRANGLDDQPVGSVQRQIS